MIRFAVMGSCLSNLPAVFLQTDYRWRRINHNVVHHSGAFLKYFVQNEPLPALSAVESMVRYKDASKENTRANLLECFPETAGRLEMPAETPGILSNLREAEIDVILMDNLHDLTVRTADFAGNSEVGPFSVWMPFHLFENEAELAACMKYSDPLPGGESARNWSRIVSFVRHHQPKAKIVFSCAPSSTSFDDPDRYERAQAFHLAMREMSRTWRDFLLLPPLEVAGSYTRFPQDFAHFDMAVYRAIAGMLFLQVNTNFQQALS